LRSSYQQILGQIVLKRAENGGFAIVLVAASVAFAWILWPLFGAILWGVLLAIIFMPVYQIMLAWMPGWRNAAAFATVLMIAILVVFPLIVVGAGLVQEVSGLFERFQSGELDLRRSFSELRSSLPEWALNLLTQAESTRIADLMERFSTALMQGGQFIASQIISIGQATLNLLLNVFVLLYLLFYLLRDGGTLLVYLQRATPLPPEQQQVFANKFTATVRGTLKGDLVIAIVQGILGGLLFWILDLGTPILWGAVMAVLSLLPVVGTGFVWGPAAVYLLLTGSIGQGIVVLVYGALVISTVEYILRPLLVGNDVKMPSYVVLLSSLGGIATFGINGFVIGPLVAAVFLAAWEMHLQTRDTQQRVPPS
jgi:predicted PurR-regulated permease PerM